MKNYENTEGATIHETLKRKCSKQIVQSSERLPATELVNSEKQRARNFSGNELLAQLCRGERPTFVPWDLEIARNNFGANCGPASFAAVTGDRVCLIMQYFLHFEHSKWTNLTQMRQAFRMAGHDYCLLKRRLPTVGVALVQWMGPWTERDFFARNSLPYTHWVGVIGDWIFENSLENWVSLSEWSAWAQSECVKSIPTATHWAVKYGVELSNSSASCRTGSAGLGSGTNRRVFNFLG